MLCEMNFCAAQGRAVAAGVVRRSKGGCEMSDYFIGPQVLTLAIPLGFFLLVCFWLFFQRERTR